MSQQREVPPPPAIEWSAVKVGLKELVAALVFVATAAGFYYKVFYQQAQDKIVNEQQTAQLLQEIAANRERIKSLEDQVKELHDDKIRREAVEATQSSNGYRAMKPVSK